MKRLLIAVLCFVMLLGSVSCGDDGLIEYTDDSGITVRLPEGYSKFNMDGFTYALFNDDTFFFAMRESFADLYDKHKLSSDASLAEYAQLVANGNGIQTRIILNSKDDLYFVYGTKSEDGTEHFFYATVKRGSDAFWLCQFACPIDKQEEMSEQFDLWADKIKVD